MQGIILAVAAYTIWGIFPLFFSYLSDIAPIEVVTHRIIWSLVAMLLIGLLLRRWGKLFTALTDKKLIAWMGLSALLIGINWMTYIWAVANHRVLESSLGYFMTPVVSLILARLFFKERLHPLQAWAGFFAVVAVIWEFISLGTIPWISLVLAVAFAFYGVVRKHCKVDGISGLTIEMFWLLPLGMGWIAWQFFDQHNDLAFGSSQTVTLLLISSGFLTALPLVLFAMAARRVDLSIVGFIMYINPSIQFLIAVFVLNESYPSQRMVTFCIIWFALILFMMGLWKMRKEP
ncbi:MAG: EamA family transporter RarD [Pseudomonadota bacterium]|nr:EamA family transporter RarD [Pseudomonadota bacterium]